MTQMLYTRQSEQRQVPLYIPIAASNLHSGLRGGCGWNALELRFRHCAFVLDTMIRNVRARLLHLTFYTFRNDTMVSQAIATHDADC